MKPEKLVQLLTEAIRKIGYKVRTEEGNFRGGSCIFAQEHLVILNRRMSQEERAEVLARALANESLDSIFLLPEVRAYIETFMSEPSAPSPAQKETEPSDAPDTPPETNESDSQ
jgi:hypothetical protein